MRREGREEGRRDGWRELAFRAMRCTSSGASTVRRWRVRGEEGEEAKEEEEEGEEREERRAWRWEGDLQGWVS